LIDELAREGARRVNDKRVDPATAERQRFSSAILPPWARKTPQIEQVLPLLYLHDLSSGDFLPTLGQFLGSTKGLSAATIKKLTQTWQAEQKVFAQRDLSGVDYAYVCGPTASTSTCAWTRPSRACWC
jgi:hypothetical protein